MWWSVALTVPSEGNSGASGRVWSSSKWPHTSAMDQRSVASAPLRGTEGFGAGLLSVVDLADDGVIEVAGDRGVRMPRPLVAGGALVGSVTVCSAW